MDTNSPQDQYGSQNGLYAMAGGMNPWVGIAQFLMGRFSAAETGSIDAANRNQQSITGGKDINARHDSPYGVANYFGAQLIPGSEKLNPANRKPLEVAPGWASQAPASYSSASPWADVYARYGQY